MFPGLLDYYLPYELFCRFPGYLGIMSNVPGIRWGRAAVSENLVRALVSAGYRAVRRQSDRLTVARTNVRVRMDQVSELCR